MDIKKVQEYKKTLETERMELVKSVEKEEKPEDFGSDLDHGDEEANEAENFGYQLAEAQDLKDRISAIDVALSKIKNGGYGKCEKCGKEIEEKILNLSPESRFCLDCKKKASGKK